MDDVFFGMKATVDEDGICHFENGKSYDLNCPLHERNNMDWIKIENKLPNESENVILFDGYEVFCGRLFFDRDGKIFWGIQPCDGECYGNYEKNKITHWMPLPQPPKE